MGHRPLRPPRVSPRNAESRGRGVGLGDEENEGKCTHPGCEVVGEECTRR